MNANDIIRTLNLAQHPEGGWYAETYRDAPAAPFQPVLGSRAHQEARLTASVRSLKLQEFREAAKNLGAA